MSLKSTCQYLPAYTGSSWLLRPVPSVLPFYHSLLAALLQPVSSPPLTYIYRLTLTTNSPSPSKPGNPLCRSIVSVYIRLVGPSPHPKFAPTKSTTHMPYHPNVKWYGGGRSRESITRLLTTTVAPGLEEGHIGVCQTMCNGGNPGNNTVLCWCLGPGCMGLGFPGLPPDCKCSTTSTAAIII